MTAIQRGPSLLRYRNPPRSAFRGFRGLGQDSTDGITVPTSIWQETGVTDSGISYGIDQYGVVRDVTTLQPLSASIASTVTGSASSGGGTPASTGTGNNWATILSNAITTAGKTAQTALTGTTYTQTPYGTTITTTGGSPATGMNLLSSSQLSSYMPIILIGGAVVVFAMVMGSRR